MIVKKPQTNSKLIVEQLFHLSLSEFMYRLVMFCPEIEESPCQILIET